MIFKGSFPRLKFQDLILRYLGSRIRLRTQNSSVRVIFDDYQKNQKNNFSKFRRFQIISELNLSSANIGP